MNRVLQAFILSHSKAPTSFFKTEHGRHPNDPSKFLSGNPIYSSSCRANEKLQNHVKVSSNRKSLYQFSAFSTAKDLSTKKCVPCDSKDIRAMVEQSANELIPKVPGWNLVNEGGTLKLQRSWKAKSFMKGLELFQAVADVAEAEGHHPDLHLVGWNNVKIEIWTHSVGGLTENDFILAAKINSLDLVHLLRRKAVA